MDGQLVDYSRQQEFDNEIGNHLPKDESNIIIGCGGVGFWLGIFLAMNGYNDFFLMDGEKLDSTNLNRIPVPQTWVGQNKAVALRKLIRQLRPATRIVCLSSHITENTLDVISEFVKKQTLYRTTVWDTTDNALIQVKISKFVNDLKTRESSGLAIVKYRKIGYEAWDVGCYENYNIWVDEANYQPGYRTSRANSITSAMAAGLGFFARGLNINHDTAFNIKNMLQQGISQNEIDTETKRLLIRAKEVLENTGEYAENEEYASDIPTTQVWQTAEAIENYLDQRGT